MKQLGNLAIVCAGRPNVLMQLYDGYVSVHAGEGPDRHTMNAKWHDDEAISRFIHELNFGKYSEKKQNYQQGEAAA